MMLSYKKFDVELCESWDAAMTNGHFRYNLDEVRSRLINGRVTYIADLNTKRSIERRKPHPYSSLNTPFNSQSFNFNKVREDECLFELVNTDTSNGHKKRNVVMINVSPLASGHVLIVPDIEAGLPQVLTEYCVCVSIEALLLSSQHGFRVGFNSLCAYASVNHLHTHGYYESRHVYVENCPVSRLSGPCYEITSMPIKGFVLQLHNSCVEKLSKLVYRICGYFHESEIAHNVFLTRGTACDDPDVRTVRAVIWPRQTVTQEKNQEGSMFNVAVVELAGHLICKDTERFDSFTELDVEEVFAAHRLPDDVYNRIRSHVKCLMNEEL